MIRVNVVYPARDGARFDHDYYVQRHIALIRDRMKDYGLGAIAVDKGIAAAPAGGPPPFTAVISLVFESPEQMQAGLAIHGAEIFGDTINFSDIQPTMQISEILL